MNADAGADIVGFCSTIARIAVVQFQLRVVDPNSGSSKVPRLSTLGTQNRTSYQKSTMCYMKLRDVLEEQQRVGGLLLEGAEESHHVCRAEGGLLDLAGRRQRLRPAHASVSSDVDQCVDADQCVDELRNQLATIHVTALWLVWDRLILTYFALVHLQTDAWAAPQPHLSGKRKKVPGKWRRSVQPK